MEGRRRVGRPPDSILITGAALATPLGLTRDQTWRAVRAGQCGMRPLTALESPLAPDKLGGQALDLPADYRPDDPREVRYLSWTLRDALRDAGVADKLPYPSYRCGVVLGTTLHGMRAGGQYFRSSNFEPLRNFLASNTLARACAGFELDGFAATTCSACSSSLGAIALAMTLLRSGELDLVVTGGYDTISEYVYGGFSSLKLVADGPLRPFARGRQGMKLAEGYGIVVLERDGDAKARGATALATILGCGESADAHHLTQPHPTGDGAARAIESALDAGGLTIDDIDLIAAHATGTPDNDAGEYAAFARVFGDRLPRVPVVAFKSHLGHTLGGAGAVELVLSALALRDQVIPPCANSLQEDVEFAGLNLATGSEKPGKLRATLNTSLGFGGANTAAVLTHDVAWASRSSTFTPSGETLKPPTESAVLITGIGVIVPGAVGNNAFARLMNETRQQCWSADTGAIAESDYLHLLNARRVRRMSEYVKLTLAATTLALRDAGLEGATDLLAGCSAILGSEHGSADFSATYYREIVRQGLIGANPVLFAEGVPNAAAAHLSLMLALRGGCQTIIGSRTSGLDALHLAALRIRSGEWDRAIVSAGEEYNPLVNGAYGHCGLYAGATSGAAPAAQKGFVTGSAAVTFVLESREVATARGATAKGRILCTAAGRGRPNEAVESACRVLEALSSRGPNGSSLGAPPAVLTSMSGTWVDRSEAAALRRTAAGATISSIYGHIAEHFAATPLLAVASVLLSGHLPRLLSEPPRELRAAHGSERPDRVAAICTDFTGCVSGVHVAMEGAT
jgi:3-oxoacyl-[acyl-carrier-protein] synthase II